MELTRRDLLKLGVVASLAGCATLTREDGVVSSLGRGGDALLLDTLVRTLSRYDIVHFGEEHPRVNTKETSPLEDFVELLLPRFRDKRLVERPFNVIRTEYLIYEYDGREKPQIPENELIAFDKSGVINPNEMPTMFKEVLASGENRDPYGSQRIARESVKLGYKVRGLHISIAEVYTIKGEVMLRSRVPSEVLVHMLIQANNRNYTRAIKSDMQGANRLIVYGGAHHNDGMPLGIGDTMRYQFPNKYVAVDLIKPSTDSPEHKHYDKKYYDILRAQGFDPDKLSQIVILVRDKDPRADYVLFLPTRKVLK